MARLRRAEEAVVRQAKRVCAAKRDRIHDEIRELGRKLGALRHMRRRAQCG